MKKNILELIKESATSEKAFKDLENIYALSEQLQYASNIEQMAEDIYSWLLENFNVDNINFSLFDIDKNTKELIFTKGEEFYLDDEMASYFIINTHTNLNAIISFNTNSKVHYKILQRDNNIIQSAFFQISAIIQNGILKRNFVKSQSIDSVTNVYNRQYLTTHVKKLLALKEHDKNNIFFLMVGIDHFKAVIDEFDYDIGDIVLIELAKVIHSNICEYDLVARLTGDEFLISLLNHNNKDSASKISQKIIDDFAKVKVLVHNKYTLQKTVCIGIKEYRVSSSVDDAIKNADIALYEAKNLGRGKLQHFDEISVEDSIDLF